MRVRPSLLLLAALAGAAFATPARADLKLPRVSPNASVSQTVGTTDVTVKYCRPGVKGRTVWGALVPYGKPWRTGANEITTFTTSDEITVEGQKLPAGTYGLVTIPSPDQWIVVFSKQKDMWGAFTYDSTKDQLRVTVKPQPADMQEWMQFTLDLTAPDAFDLALRWEKLRVPVHCTVDVNGMVLAAARDSVAAAKSDDWRTPYRAANWAYDAGVSPQDVAVWSARALKAKENWSTLSLAAKVAQKQGDSKQAVAQMTKAISLAKADKNVLAEQVEPLQKLLDTWSAK